MLDGEKYHKIAYTQTHTHIFTFYKWNSLKWQENEIAYLNIEIVITIYLKTFSNLFL